MNTNKYFLIAAMIFTLFPATYASATVLDFNELANDSSYEFVNPISTNGFIISNSQNSPAALGVWGRNSPYQADPGNAAVFVNYGYTTTTLAADDGSAFDFISIDLADVYNNGVGSIIEFIFTDSLSNVTSTTVTLDTLVGLQTFIFNMDDMIQVSWTTASGDSGFGQFDNIVLNEGSPVPVPAAIWLFGSGIMGLVGLSRRRRLAA